MPPMIGWSLEMVLDPEQELFKLARIIDWSQLEVEFPKPQPQRESALPRSRDRLVNLRGQWSLQIRTTG